MSLKAIDHIIESEVLVIGSGLAGSMAAIKSHQLGRKVAMANKGPLVGGGATSIIAAKTMNICFPTDDKHFWMRKFLEAGENNIDLEWVKIHLEDTYKYAMELDQMGKLYREAPFPRNPLNKKDEPWRLNPWGGDVPQDVLFDGPAAEATFKKKITADKIPFFERVHITNLLTDGHQVLGAVGFNYRTGETYMFKASAIILAAGGMRFGENVANNLGEGLSMAYEAKARIRFPSKGGARILLRDRTREGALHDHFHSNGLTYPWLATLVNRLGEAFMEKVSPGPNLEDISITEAAVRKEIEEGRGPIYENWTRIPSEWQEILKNCRKADWKLTRSLYGLDLFKSKVPFVENRAKVALPGGTSHSGVEIDRQCATGVSGLYAVGDNACNLTAKLTSTKVPIHGTGTSWALLTGSRVSQFVAEYIADAPVSVAADREAMEQAKEYVANLALPLTRSSGPSPEEVDSNLLSCLVSFDAIRSDKNKLEKVLREISRLQKEEMPRIRAKDFRDLKKAAELHSVLLNLEIILRRELFRWESGMPEGAPRWIIMEKQDGRMHVYGKDIPVPLHITPQVKKG